MPASTLPRGGVAEFVNCGDDDFASCRDRHSRGGDHAPTRTTLGGSRWPQPHTPRPATTVDPVGFRSSRTGSTCSSPAIPPLNWTPLSPAPPPNSTPLAPVATAAPPSASYTGSTRASTSATASPEADQCPNPP